MCSKYTRTLVFLMKNINFIDHIAIILMSLTRTHTQTREVKKNVDNFIIQSRSVSLAHFAKPRKQPQNFYRPTFDL